MRLLHRHRWEPRETFVFQPWEIRTRVLYVCEDCGRPRVKTVNGKWSIADLRSKRERETDMDALLDEVQSR